MKEGSNNRNRWLHIRLNDSEQAKIIKQFKRTTERHISQYARKILLGKPMIARTRDESLNNIITILAKLQKDLNGIGNNYNQMLHKLHLADTVPEIKRWLVQYEKEKLSIQENIRQIKFFMEKSSEKWLR